MLKKGNELGLKEKHKLKIPAVSKKE
jgi:hypothetical protein